MDGQGHFHFAIDRGGTFTDIWCKQPDGTIREVKLLSEDPRNYGDAPREGIRRIMEEFTGTPIKQGELIESSSIAWVRMGTTVATNALLERKGERMGLLVTQGFKDLLYIGNQSRPKIFDINITTPDMLYDCVVEVEERVLMQDQVKGFYKQPTRSSVSNTGEEMNIVTELNVEKVKLNLQNLLDMGIRSIAVALMHSYMYDNHEVKIRDLALSMGFKHVSLSSAVMPMIRIVPRGHTACADAYLTPCIRRYIHGFASGFHGGLDQMSVLFMQSDGGLTEATSFSGAKAMLSGPAGGVVGYAATSFCEVTRQPVIGFDMGGTSTDVSRYAGSFEHVMESTTAGITVQAPQLDINTVAAGGGSRLFFRSGMFVVGPESAGAHPGPVCYRKGGFLTITDANLVLGRIVPEYFPSIFGDTQDLPLDRDASLAAFQQLTSEVNEFIKESQEGSGVMTVQEVAMGFIAVANEAMCRPIRALTQGKGYDTSRHILACFGGAGGQHACSIARNLGMSKIIVHKYAGILSAYGLALADAVAESQRPFSGTYNHENIPRIDTLAMELIDLSVTELKEQGFVDSSIVYEVFLHLRYQGTDCALMCSSKDSQGDTVADDGQSKYGNYSKTFINRYQTEFGFILPDRDIMVDDIRVRAVGKSISMDEPELPQASEPPQPVKAIPCYFDKGFEETNIFWLKNLHAGHAIKGPAIIQDSTGTILVEPCCIASITNKGDVVIEVHDAEQNIIGTELQAIPLSIFSHRFMSIAEQMGRVLQRTSISTNIKERLDFSCAVFGADGGLVANAPHIPVHLGAMQETVQYQIRTLRDDIKEGDVLLSNHPKAGGSHLPDLTVITPVFSEGSKRPVFFVASRGHHADIGGITPGSMPPHSTTIHEEGAIFKSFKLVNNGRFMEQELVAALKEPANYPGGSGTRNLADNLSDLRAQVAANQKGINLIQGLIGEYSLDVVQAYMMHIQNNAEVAVRDMLRQIANDTLDRTGSCNLFGEDKMDDGSVIKLNISINKDQGSAVFDFADTDFQVCGNCNAPRAVTLSAIIYCLRCMVGHDVPLNQGCLNPVQVIIPPGCMLDPSEEAAVVGGNVLTSQRVVDVIFKAFAACAASQGCMNNITFGDGTLGYYETVAGGSGAGPGWHGHDGIHTHMTNTRITDPEIIEKRYPVVVQKFHLNRGTGGSGQFHGGDGVVRELMFCKPMVLSVLTERRVFQPYGLAGGQPGKLGVNHIIRHAGGTVNLGSKRSYPVQPGDIFHLESPGGGGYGVEGEVNASGQKHTDQQDASALHGGSIYTYQRMQESA